MLTGRHGNRWLLEQWHGSIAKTFKPGKYCTQRLNHMRKPILKENYGASYGCCLHVSFAHESKIKI